MNLPKGDLFKEFKELNPHEDENNNKYKRKWEVVSEINKK